MRYFVRNNGKKRSYGIDTNEVCPQLMIDTTDRTDLDEFYCEEHDRNLAFINQKGNKDNLDNVYANCGLFKTKGNCIIGLSSDRSRKIMFSTGREKRAWLLCLIPSILTIFLTLILDSKFLLFPIILLAGNVIYQLIGRLKFRLIFGLMLAIFNIIFLTTIQDSTLVGLALLTSIFATIITFLYPCKVRTEKRVYRVDDVMGKWWGLDHDISRLGDLDKQKRIEL